MMCYIRYLVVLRIQRIILYIYKYLQLLTEVKCLESIQVYEPLQTTIDSEFMYFVISCGWLIFSNEVKSTVKHLHFKSRQEFKALSDNKPSADFILFCMA